MGARSGWVGGAVAVAVLAVGVPAFAKEAQPYTKKVAIVIYDGVEILDFAGPAEVFAAAGGFGGRGEERAFEVYTVSKDRDPIVSQGFVDVIPDYSIADAPQPDIVVFPGGGTDSVTGDAAWMEWVRKVTGEADTVLTVCTGAFVAGEAGMLDGQDVTTFYRAVPGLAREFPKARVHPGRRFVDNGKLITTAGVSAGIDGSLHLVARTLGRWVADRTAEYMEYKWSPESYLSTTYAVFNPRLDARGRALQQASIAAQQGDVEGALTGYRALTAADPADADAWMGLGRTLHAAGRVEEAIPAHREAAKSERIRGNALFNLACALALTGDKDGAIEAAKGAVAAGFRGKGFFVGDPDLASVRDDPRFRALLATL